MTNVFQFDPTTDPRWQGFLLRHTRASVFETVGWLRALRKTYGYQPMAFTMSPPDSDLGSCILFCEVDSWITGRRLVSLPFSDHTDFLCDGPTQTNVLIRHLQSLIQERKWRYFQLRPIDGSSLQLEQGTGCFPDKEYFLHAIDLKPELAELFARFDRHSVQRRVQRASRERLTEKTGRSEELLRDFYTLFLLTRQRQKTPPTPYAWFQNLVLELGDAVEVRVAYKGTAPVAAIVTLQFKDISYYKYGCSDSRFKHTGATPWLLWNAITSAKLRGATLFDLGRTELDNAGLLAFKNHWARDPKKITYWRYPGSPGRPSSHPWKESFARSGFSLLPAKIQGAIGRRLYRHIG